MNDKYKKLIKKTNELMEINTIKKEHDTLIKEMYHELRNIVKKNGGILDTTFISKDIKQGMGDVNVRYGIIRDGSENNNFDGDIIFYKQYIYLYLKSAYMRTFDALREQFTDNIYIETKPYCFEVRLDMSSYWEGDSVSLLKDIKCHK